MGLYNNYKSKDKIIIIGKCSCGSEDIGGK